MKNPTNKTIFISYSSKDSDIVDKIEKGLKINYTDEWNLFNKRYKRFRI